VWAAFPNLSGSTGIGVRVRHQNFERIDFHTCRCGVGYHLSFDEARNNGRRRSRQAAFWCATTGRQRWKKELLCMNSIGGVLYAPVIICSCFDARHVRNLQSMKRIIAACDIPQFSDYCADLFFSWKCICSPGCESSGHSHGLGSRRTFLTPRTPFCLFLEYAAHS
jgi:hypothetical protein